MQRKKSKGISAPQHRALQIEELEERIAPVIVDATHWVVGDPDTGPLNAWPESPDTYWIFYIGPGQADIRAVDGNADLDGQHIGNVTITGSDITSMLFIMDLPDDDTPSQDGVPWSTDAGTICVQGNILVQNGDMGAIFIDGMFGQEWSIGQPTLTVDGTLGKLDAGILLANVHAQDDIWEIDSDTTIGAYLDVRPDPDMWVYGFHDTNITADGNIGAIRAGVGLGDQGESISGIAILGGAISGTTSIMANADGIGDPGIIDLIEARGGSLIDGNIGCRLGDNVPYISAGPGGNVRFIHLDGNVFDRGPTGWSYAVTPITIGPDAPLSERTIVDDSGGVMVINPGEVTFTTADGSMTYLGEASYLLVPVDTGTQGPGAVLARVTLAGDAACTVSGNVEVGEVLVTGDTEYPEGLVLDFADILDATSIDDLDIAQPSDITQLQGYVHQVFTGTGEADIYYVHGDRIPIFLNNTNDGDIVSASSNSEVIFIGASNNGGDIGATESITPYLIKSPLYYVDGNVAWVDSDPDPGALTPIGIEGSLMRYNSIYGVRAEGQIYGVSAGGAIGDVRAIGGGITLVVADTNHQRDPGSPLVTADLLFVPGFAAAGDPLDITFSLFGKIHNTVGDGVFGQIL